MERMFAAPFIAQLGQGHVDGVYSMAKDPGSLERLASGSGDGVVKVWNLTSRDELWQTRAHENVVRSVCWTPIENYSPVPPTNPLNSGIPTMPTTIPLHRPHTWGKAPSPLYLIIATTHHSLLHQAQSPYTTCPAPLQDQAKYYVGPHPPIPLPPFPSIKQRHQSSLPLL